MNNEKRTKNNLLYAVLGILVLVVSVTGATFAYYTATATYNGGTITGNMATITFSLQVSKMTNVDVTNNRGLIPMSNAMVQKAVSNASNNGICLDDNKNAACQIYKITVNNTGTAGMFLDGYVTLSGGSGVSTDWTSATTTMRWAQVFCQESGSVLSSCTTAGTTTTRTTGALSGAASPKTSGIDEAWSVLGTSTATDTGIKELASDALKAKAVADDWSNIKDSGVTNTGYISGNGYDIINRNYIRVSINPDNKYTQASDITSALVYNQYIAPNNNNASDNTGDSNSTYTDSQVYYIVVWLTETGHNQTANVPAGQNTTTGASTTLTDFFSGKVTFNSAQGSEVTGTFADYLAVTPDTKVS